MYPVTDDQSHDPLFVPSWFGGGAPSCLQTAEPPLDPI